MSRRAVQSVLAVLAAISVLSSVGLGVRDADAKGKRPPVIGVIADGVGEKLYGAPKLNKHALVGKALTAICDGGATAAWKLSDVGTKGELTGSFVSGSKPKHCLLLGKEDFDHAQAKENKTRPNPTEKQLADAKAAALTALTPKKGDAPAKVDVIVFHDGQSFIAIGQTKFPASEKGSCLDKGAVVVLEEKANGLWKPFFRPQPKQKNVCGYSFFTRGDVDGDGKDELALRIDKEDEVGYRVLKRSKGSYDVIAK
jgi:hypothetical protein